MTTGRISAWRRVPVVLSLLGVIAGGVSRPALAAPDVAEAPIAEAHRLAKSAATEAELTQVLALCRQAAQNDPTNKTLAGYSRRLQSWAHHRRGRLRLDTGSHALALADFEKALSLDPNNWRAVLGRGVAHVKRANYKAALADLDRVIEGPHRPVEAYFFRGEARRHLDNFNKAIEDYEIVIRRQREHAAALAGRGQARFELKLYKSAVKDYYEALRIDPDNATALIYRGEAFTYLGFYEKAAHDLRKAVQVAPDSARAYQSAAWLMATCPDAKFRQPQLALEAARKAVELGGPQVYRALDALAAAEANQGDFVAAQHTMLRAIKLAPNSARRALTGHIRLYQREQPFRTENRRNQDRVAAGPVLGDPR